MKYNLIYFDPNQLEDYFFNEDYRDAYDEFFFDKPFYTLLWSGREEDGKILALMFGKYSEYDQILINKEDVNKIWIRGKNFDYEKYKDFNVINTKIVENIADDKNKTYEYLKDLMPKSYLTQLKHAYRGYNFSGDFIIKPLNELKGNGIERINNQKTLVEYLSKKPDETFILQEFIECVDYEPLGIKGTHDIRLIIVNSEIVGLAVRQPKEGGWLCNVAQGGSIKVYDLIELAKIANRTDAFADIMNFKDKVLNRLPSDFKQAIFSIDFCNTKDGFKIFELNSYPGIRLEYKTYINKVKELLNN